MSFDTIIRGGRWFDGTGAPSAVRDIGIRDGQVVAIAENLDTKRVDDEIHPGEAIEEKISLSERFGLWISFYPFSQDDYLAVVGHWARLLGVSEAVIAASDAV